MEVSHPHHTSATSSMDTAPSTTTTTTTATSTLHPTPERTALEATNIHITTNKEAVTPLCRHAPHSTASAISPNSNNNNNNNNNNSIDIVEQKKAHQHHHSTKQSLLHFLKVPDNSRLPANLEASLRSSKEENKNVAPTEISNVPSTDLEQQTQAVKIKRCKHGRIIIKDSNRKKSSSSINQPKRSSDNVEPLPLPASPSSVSAVERIPGIDGQEEPPTDNAKSSPNQKPLQDCERLAQQLEHKPLPKLSSDTPPTNSAATCNNRSAAAPAANIDSKSNNNSNEDKSNRSPSERRHSRRNRERRRRRHDRSPTRRSPRRCSVIRNKSHSQSPSHRKSPRRYRSTSSRERSRERRRQSSRRLRRSRSPYRSSRDYRRTDSRKSIKLRSPRRHLSPISPPPRHHEHSTGRRRSPLRRHSRSSGSKSMSTSRSRSRSSSRDRSHTRTRLATSAPSTIPINDSSVKKDLPRESLDARIDNLFNDSSLRKEDSFLKKTSDASPDESSIAPQKSPKKPSTKNDYSDSASDSPSSDIYDPEGPISPLSSEPSPSGSIVRKPASNKKAYVPEKDVIPSSAVSLNQHEKYLQKKTRQERIVEEVKMALKPFYQRRAITKEQYKDVSRRAVPKICHSKNGEINPVKIRSLIHAYVKKLTHHK